MSDAARSEVDVLADKLRLVHDNPAYKTSLVVSRGYFRLDDGTFFVRLRFTGANIVTGRTEYEAIASIYSDACQYHFAPWLRPNKNKLKNYNHGPQSAADYIRCNDDVRELLNEIERNLVEQGTIPARSVKEAGRNAKTSESEFQKLTERIATLERQVWELSRFAPNNKPATEQPVITTFSPPGSMAHKPKNFVHLESVNPTAVKKLFGV